MANPFEVKEMPAIVAQYDANHGSDSTHHAKFIKEALDGLVPCPNGTVERIRPGQTMKDVCGDHNVVGRMEITT
jgi:hypothetical protein